MTITRWPRRSRNLFALGVLLLSLGGIALVAGAHNFLIRSLGLLAIIASSASIVRAARARKAPAKPSEGEFYEPGLRKGPGRLTCAIAVGLLPIFAGSYLWFEDDAMHGAHSTLPVYVFFGVVSVSAVVWGYVAAKLVARGT